MRYVAFHPVHGVYLGHTDNRAIFSLRDRKSVDAEPDCTAPTFSDRNDFARFVATYDVPNMHAQDVSALVGCEMREVFPRLNNRAGSMECAAAGMPGWGGG